jgi:hypothetical protein
VPPSGWRHPGPTIIGPIATIPTAAGVADQPPPIAFSGELDPVRRRQCVTKQEESRFRVSEIGSRRTVAGRLLRGGATVWAGLIIISFARLAGFERDRDKGSEGTCFTEVECSTE